MRVAGRQTGSGSVLPHQLGGLIPWEPDILLPAQLAKRRGLSPDQLLRVAVLEEALDTLEKCFGPLPGLSAYNRLRREHAFAEARRWLTDTTSRGGSDSFTLLDCCEALGLDAEAIAVRIEAKVLLWEVAAGVPPPAGARCIT